MIMSKLKITKTNIIVTVLTLVFLINVQEVTASSIPGHIEDMSVNQKIVSFFKNLFY